MLVVAYDSTLCKNPMMLFEVFEWINLIFILFQQVQPIFGFYFIYSIPQNNSVNYFKPRWFAKQAPNFLWVLISNQLLWIVLSTHNLEPSRSTLLLFQSFQVSASASLDQICQIWWNSYFLFSKNSTKIQAASWCNERPLHQVSAQGKIPSCQKHSVEHLNCTVSLHF